MERRRNKGKEGLALGPIKRNKDSCQVLVFAMRLLEVADTNLLAGSNLVDKYWLNMCWKLPLVGVLNMKETCLNLKSKSWEKVKPRTRIAGLDSIELFTENASGHWNAYHEVILGRQLGPVSMITMCEKARYPTASTVWMWARWLWWLALPYLLNGYD